MWSRGKRWIADDISTAKKKTEKLTRQLSNAELIRYAELQLQIINGAAKVLSDAIIASDST